MLALPVPLTQGEDVEPWSAVLQVRPYLTALVPSLGSSPAIAWSKASPALMMPLVPWYEETPAVAVVASAHADAPGRRC